VVGGFVKFIKFGDKIPPLGEGVSPPRRTTGRGRWGFYPQQPPTTIEQLPPREECLQY